MFTNFVLWVFYSLINSDLATRHEVLMKMTWALDRQQAIIDLVGGTFICGWFVAIMFYVGTKINEAYNANS